MKRALIVGAGVAGRDVLREIKKSPDLGFKIVGFIDDDARKQGTSIDGTRVIGSKKNLRKILKKKKIDKVIIAIPSAEGESIAEYVRLCSDEKVDIRIVPRVREIIEGKAHTKALRKVQVEDLLGRPVIKADVAEIKNFFKGKRVLVTGAAGSIGSELSRQIAAYIPPKLVLLDWWENGIFELKQDLAGVSPRLKVRFVIGDIKDSEKMKQIFDEERPDYIYHAAAYKHVPLMEENPEEAVKNNIFGTLNIAKLAVKYKTKKFILVSTDKAAKPANVMGATKLITEGIGRMLNGRTKFMTVRFGNVLDSYGSAVPIFRKQIQDGGPVTITDKRMTRYFMTIPEAVQLILKAGMIGKGGELFVLDMGKPVRILDLAENLIRLSGYVPYEDIDIVVIGKRAGEKIHEKLFIPKEKLEATTQDKIFVTKSMGIDIRRLPRFLKNLKFRLKEGEISALRAEINAFVRSGQQ